MSRIVVIGSGFGGLSVAARLAARGHQVELFEKRDKLGGRAYVYDIDGFRFDGGPTVITAPWIFDDIWRAAGRRRQDYFQLVPCDPFYRIFDESHRPFDVSADHDAMLRQIEQRSPADVEGYNSFLANSKEIFSAGMALIDQPFLQLSDMIGVVPDLIRLQSYRSVYGYVSKFFQDDFLRCCFSFQPLLIGGNPLTAASIYVLIHYLERQWGIHYAVGGTGAIINAFGRLLHELGVRVHLNAEVDRILIEQRRAHGVRLKDGTVHRADGVVSNADAAWTYLNLIPTHQRPRNSDRRIKSKSYSMSLFVIYFGTKRQYRDAGLAHHNIMMHPDYTGLLREIFRNKDLPKEFSLYLHMPTLTDPSLAPAGGEAFYVLSPVPHLGADIDWERQSQSYRDAIMDFLEQNYLPDLQANIVAEHRIDPRHFAGTLNSYLGSAFSIQPTLTQSAWFRPHNRSEDVDNLYFVGAGTHPGAGVPGVVSSAKIVDSLIGDPVTVGAPSPSTRLVSTHTAPSAPVETPPAGG
ncbi:MAG: phytoene desaturase [Caldilineaceae bacterium]|nr:phytoene desaturase [Caldilineaceae bacterium]MDE0338499.1 phytoene desaturase [Caldilineaceae bacterium]